jgi:hypothetical protein
MGEGRRDSASERDGDDVYIEYGSGGRDITFQEIEGVKEGTSPAQAGIGKPGDGGLVSDQ